MTISSTRFFALLAVFVIGVALSGAIYAQAVGGEIKACVNTSGAVYIIGDGFKKATCARGEQLLTWNQQGPKGDMGVQGEKGDEGLQGEPGPKGDKGETGESGSTLHVFDGSGNNLGIFVGYNYDNQGPLRWHVFLSSIGGFIEYASVPSTRTISIEPSARILYIAPNCAGTPYAEGEKGGYFQHVIRSSNGGTPLFITTNDAPINGNPVSYLGLGTACNNQDPPGVQRLYPLQQISEPNAISPVWPLEVR